MSNHICFVSKLCFSLQSLKNIRIVNISFRHQHEAAKISPNLISNKHYYHNLLQDGNKDLNRNNKGIFKVSVFCRLRLILYFVFDNATVKHLGR